MEILVLHILSAGLYFVLLVYLFFRKIKTNKFLIIAILLSLNWNMQGIQGNWLLDEYTANPYSYFFMHYGWLIYLQSLYLSIPGGRTKRGMSFYLINGLLVALLLFHFFIGSIGGNNYFDKTTINLAAFLVSIAMLFYLENIIRYLKTTMRYSCKHQFFILSLMALLLLLNTYFSLTDDMPHLQLGLMSIFIHLLVPVFLIVSSYRLSDRGQISFDRFDPEGHVQYFMVFIGSGLFLAGLLELSDLYLTSINSVNINAIVSILVIGLTGVFLLSNEFRTILISAFRSYFYNDRNDYRLEWEKINTITNTEENIFDNILSYYLGWSGLDSGALYIEKNGEMSLSAKSGSDFDLVLPNSKISRILDSHYKSNLYRVESTEADQYVIWISLALDERQVALCCLPQTNPNREIDDASVTLCETVSKTFAIRLRELQQRQVISRQQKLAGFNKTVAFLAHDLKNIAAQQQLATENFVDNKRDSDFLEDFNETISYTTSRLIKIIEQFNLSGRSGKQLSHLVSIEHLIAGIKDYSVRSGFDIHLIENIGESASNVDSRLLSMVNNLIKNSVEASSNDYNVEVSISLQDRGLVVVVSDQGAGMTTDFIDNGLFEPFTTLKGERGLGIGMYQVKEIVTELEGTIDIDSEVGRGTRVTLKIPPGHNQDAE